MMKQYAKTDATGKVVGLRHSERQPGSQWFEVTKSDHNFLSANQDLMHVGGGVLKAVAGTVIPKPTVEMARAQSYPSVGDQLGAIWKAIAPLIDHPEAAEILAKIQAIKDANPKAGAENASVKI